VPSLVSSLLGTILGRRRGRVAIVTVPLVLVVPTVGHARWGRRGARAESRQTRRRGLPSWGRLWIRILVAISISISVSIPVGLLRLAVGITVLVTVLALATHTRTVVDVISSSSVPAVVASTSEGHAAVTSPRI